MLHPNSLQSVRHTSGIDRHDGHAKSLLNF
jgi:hypothetical protein